MLLLLWQVNKNTQMFVTNPLTNYPIRIGGRTFSTLVRQIQNGQTLDTKPRAGGGGRAKKPRRKTKTKTKTGKQRTKSKQN